MIATTTAAVTQPPAAPLGHPAVPDDLRVADWISTSDPDLELDTDQTVGDVRQSYRDLYLADCESQNYPPALFAGANGQVYAAEIGVVVRPATPEEVREAVEAEKESALDAAVSRAKRLDGYLTAPAT